MAAGVQQPFFGVDKKDKQQLAFEGCSLNSTLPEKETHTDRYLQVSLHPIVKSPNLLSQKY